MYHTRIMHVPFAYCTCTTHALCMYHTRTVHTPHMHHVHATHVLYMHSAQTELSMLTPKTTSLAQVAGSNAAAMAEGAETEKAGMAEKLAMLEKVLLAAPANDATEKDAAAVSPDLQLVGRWRTRNDVLEYGLRPIVARVQALSGFSSYEQYENELRGLMENVQTAVSYEMEADTADGRNRAQELIKVACELSQMLARTAICKSMASPNYPAQRLLILHQNKWAGGTAEASTEGFARKAKMLTVFQRISKGVESTEGLLSRSLCERRDL